MYELNTTKSVVIAETKKSTTLDLLRLSSLAMTALRQNKIKVPSGNPYILKEGGHAFVLHDMRDMRRAQNVLMFFFSTHDPEVSMRILSEQLRVMAEDKSFGKPDYNRLYSTAVKLQLHNGRQAVESTIAGKTPITAETPPVHKNHYILFCSIIINSYHKTGSLQLTNHQKEKLVQWLALIVLVFPDLRSEKIDYLLSCHRINSTRKRNGWPEKQSSGMKLRKISSTIDASTIFTPTKASMSGEKQHAPANLIVDLPYHLEYKKNLNKLMKFFHEIGVKLENHDRIGSRSIDTTETILFQFQNATDRSRAKRLMNKYYSNESQVKIQVVSQHHPLLQAFQEKKIEEELRQWDSQVKYPPPSNKPIQLLNSIQQKTHNPTKIASNKKMQSLIPQAYDPYNLFQYHNSMFNTY